MLQTSFLPNKSLPIPPKTSFLPQSLSDLEKLEDAALLALTMPQGAQSLTMRPDDPSFDPSSFSKLLKKLRIQTIPKNYTRVGEYCNSEGREKFRIYRDPSEDDADQSNVAFYVYNVQEMGSEMGSEMAGNEENGNTEEIDVQGTDENGVENPSVQSTAKGVADVQGLMQMGVGLKHSLGDEDVMV